MGIAWVTWQTDTSTFIYFIYFVLYFSRVVDIPCGAINGCSCGLPFNVTVFYSFIWIVKMNINEMSFGCYTVWKPTINYQIKLIVYLRNVVLQVTGVTGIVKKIIFFPDCILQCFIQSREAFILISFFIDVNQF